MELQKVNIRQRSDSCLIVLIFGMAAHYAWENENELIVYSTSPAVKCTPVNMDNDFRPGTNGLTLKVGDNFFNGLEHPKNGSAMLFSLDI